MSEVRVNNIVDYGGKGAPTFDNGAVISGVSSLGNQAKIGGNVTITSGGINVSGVTTAATLSGNLTGDVNTGFVTATSAVIGSGVTINAGGLNITGVMTATTFEGSGASMTGVAMTITPLSYNPDPSDSGVTRATGIGITFDHRILAGSGNITLSVATNAGAAGTVVENFGVGSSVTIAGRKATITPTSSLSYSETYHISYPSGSFTNTGGDVDYVGTAYTFGVVHYAAELYMWGNADAGELGVNSRTYHSSPIQIPGTTWMTGSRSVNHTVATKSDGTLWAWGFNNYGGLGQNNRTRYSSPVQVGTDTTWDKANVTPRGSMAIKTDGTLWSWGYNAKGVLGLNSTSPAYYSSPVQVPGTTWSSTGPIGVGIYGAAWGLKTDGTLWAWGNNQYGQLGQNNKILRSSPIQIPGVWSDAVGGTDRGFAINTDGELWGWGAGNFGALAQNNTTYYSSPVQIPGTTWKKVTSYSYGAAATKTDGTLWTWGINTYGILGLNQAHNTQISSPVQIPGTTWDIPIVLGARCAGAIKTDGTLWAWGYGNVGALGHNNTVDYSSPVQLPGTTWNIDNMYKFSSGNAPVGGMYKKVT